jgi:hypothetical protein
MALHEQSVGATDEWYTPPHVFTAMGVRFDLDVSSPGHNVVPWIPTDAHVSSAFDGLTARWDGFVWMNPPFGGRNGLVPWLERFFDHGNGVALVPDRTSAPWWQRFSPRADRTLFVAEKLKFLTPDPILGSRKNKDGTRTPQPSEFPGLYVGSQPAQGTCLLAAGDRGYEALEAAERAGLGVNFVRSVAA